MSEKDKNITTQVTDYVSILRVAICDDKKEHANHLKQILFHIRSNRDIEIETFFSSKELLQSLRERNQEVLPDIVFMDIEMPEIDGIMAGKQMRKLYADSFLVFVTAYPEYAVQGYEAGAFRYVLKPFSEQDIAKILLEIGKELGKRKRMLVQENGTEYIIPLNDIIYICAEDKYTVIYTKNRHYVDTLSLNFYEKLLLPYGFYRTHRKYMVNLFHHKGMEKAHIYLTGDIRIPISRRRKNAYHKELLENLEKDLI